MATWNHNWGCGPYSLANTYGTLIAAINFDRSGTTRIGRFVLNHSFMLPGLVATATAVAVGLVRLVLVFLSNYLGAAAVILTAEDLAEIDSASKAIPVQGHRYSEAAQKMINR